MNLFMKLWILFAETYEDAYRSAAEAWERSVDG